MFLLKIFKKDFDLYFRHTDLDNLRLLRNLVHLRHLRHLYLYFRHSDLDHLCFHETLPSVNERGRKKRKV
jgi:hypothetical protein